MILTVTLNLAVDVTYHVERVRWDATNAVAAVARRAGGKGVNVARVLHGLGRDVVVTGLAGGRTGAAARAELSASGLADATVAVEGESRTTLVVVEDGGAATGFSEPGPHVSGSEWSLFLARFEELVEAAEAAVLSGSVPPGVPDDAYAQLIAAARRAGVPALLDASGAALGAGVSAGPALVKVNDEEISGHVPGSDPVPAAASLRREGADAAVISRGPAGLVAVSAEGAWRAAPPERLTGNPTGAGDAAAASLVVGLLDGAPWPERLVDAVALSAAAVHSPQAGSFDLDAYRRYRREATAEAIAPGGVQPGVAPA